MKTYKIPNYVTGFGCDADNIMACQMVGILPRGFGIFGSKTDWESKSAVNPSDPNKKNKYWRDNSVTWNPVDSYNYLRVARNPDQTYAKTVPTPTITVGAYGLATQNFYNTYLANFKEIPKLEYVVYLRDEAGSLNFGGNAFSDPPPIGSGNNIVTSEDLSLAFPHNVALRFTNGGTEVEAFFWEDYQRENPVPVATPAPSNTFTDAELVNTATIIVDSTMTVSQKALALRSILK